MGLPVEPPVAQFQHTEPIRVVTISAAFGAGGSQLAPMLARRLGWRFLDRAIPAEVAQRLAVPLVEALARDDQEDTSRLRRLLSSFRNIDPTGTAPAVPAGEGGRDDFVAATEAVLCEAADGGEVVVLGRAGAVVLGERPGVLHVRLDATPERRVRQAVAATGEPVDEVRRHMEAADRAREAYVKRIYRTDPCDARLYHVTMDSTRLPFGACVDALAGLVRHSYTWR